MINTLFTILNSVAVFSRGIEQAYLQQKCDDCHDQVIVKCSIAQLLPLVTKIAIDSKISIYQKIAGYSISLIAVIAKSSPKKDLRNRISLPIDMANILFSGTLAYNLYNCDINDITTVALCGFNAGCALDSLLKIKRNFY